MKEKIEINIIQKIFERKNNKTEIFITMDERRETKFQNRKKFKL